MADETMDRDAGWHMLRPQIARIRAMASAAYAMECGAKPGEYERKGDGGYEGVCAGCIAYVFPDEPSVIRHHDTLTGGIFHQRCAPTGAGWFGVDGTEAADTEET